MSAGGSWDGMIERELAELAGTPLPIECTDCGRPYAGDRAAARRDHWEPYSSRSQQALDHGPMVCPECIRQLLDALDAGMRAAAARGVDVWGVAARILNDQPPTD